MNKWTTQEMAQRLARDIEPGWYVNIGIGMPEMVCENLREDDDIILQSENGILGMGPLARGDDIDTNLVNAGKKPVTARLGASYFEHTTSFAMMRGGHLDLCILGAFQVSGSGDLVNWSLGRPGIPPAVGGAMDLAVGAKRVYVIMDHTTKDGGHKILPQCTLPLTGLCVVTRVYTDLAVLERRHDRMHVIDLAPGVSFDMVQRATSVPLIAP